MEYEDKRPIQPEIPLTFPELYAELPLLPARMINEYQYCPRLAYLEWIQGEWADTQPGEMDLSNRRESQLKEIRQSIEDIGALKMFTAVAGSYLLENQTPPCIK